jgi:transcriptional regulator with GAF, ATPase, and Fis domain
MKTGKKTSEQLPAHSRNLDKLVELSKLLLAESDMGRVLTMAMDQLIELTGAERAVIILFDNKGNKVYHTARKLEKKDIENPKFEISHTIINKVRTSGKPQYLRNAHQDRVLQKNKSIARFKILSVICLPLIFKGRVFGVIYLDNRTIEGIFKKEICDFAMEFADFISLAAYNALALNKLSNRVEAFEHDLRERYNFDSIIGHHPNMVKILKVVSRIADSDATVLILGESGTGKELIARSLHFNSTRKDKPFVAINCGAIQENLIESELFGHVKGAFTGAFKNEIGWFGRANGGTVFLDEVSDMSPSLQSKLLRVLQTNEYSPVGGSVTYYSNIRIIAATNTDLKKLVDEKIFREDLFYRLNVVDLTLPPLRERKSDIQFLAIHFLEKYGRKHPLRSLKFSQEAFHKLVVYDFPGNVRELENIVERAVALTEDDVIDSSFIPLGPGKNKNETLHIDSFKKLSDVKREAAWYAEEEYIKERLQDTRGHITNAAKKAGIDVSDFHKAMKKHNIVPNDYK